MIIPISEFPDYALEGLYNKIVKTGVGDDIFYGKDIDCKAFIADMRSQDNYVVLLAEKNEIIGGGCLNNFHSNTAKGHFFCFPSIWGNAANYMKELVDHWFDLEWNNEKVVDVVIGEYPANLERVAQFILRLGGSYLGEIPEVSFGKEKVGMKIVYLTREAYHEFWRRG